MGDLKNVVSNHTAQLHNVEGTVSTLQGRLAELEQSVSQNRAKLEVHENDLNEVHGVLFEDEEVEDGGQQNQQVVAGVDAEAWQQHQDDDEAARASHFAHAFLDTTEIAPSSASKRPGDNLTDRDGKTTKASDGSRRRNDEETDEDENETEQEEDDETKPAQDENETEQEEDDETKPAPASRRWLRFF